MRYANNGDNHFEGLDIHDPYDLDSMGEGGLLMSEEDFMQHIGLEQDQINLVTEELNQSLLEMAVKIAEKSWFWRFKSPASKASIITRIYKRMKKLIREG